MEIKGEIIHIGTEKPEKEYKMINFIKRILNIEPLNVGDKVKMTMFSWFAFDKNDYGIIKNIEFCRNCFKTVYKIEMKESKNFMNVCLYDFYRCEIRKVYR